MVEYGRLCLFHHRVVIRGDPQEEAVLCTEKKSYELRVADTSNALLVTPTLSFPSDPSTCTHSNTVASLLGSPR